MCKLNTFHTFVAEPNISVGFVFIEIHELIVVFFSHLRELGWV